MTVSDGERASYSIVFRTWYSIPTHVVFEIGIMKHTVTILLVSTTVTDPSFLRVQCCHHIVGICTSTRLAMGVYRLVRVLTGNVTRCSDGYISAKQTKIAVIHTAEKAVQKSFPCCIDSKNNKEYQNQRRNFNEIHLCMNKYCIVIDQVA